MGVVINPESELFKEHQKWEQFPRHHVDGSIIPAGNPYVFRPYPKMLYKAHEARTGKICCMAGPVSPFGWVNNTDYERAVAEADTFTKSCQKIVHSESEENEANRQGWRETPDKALALAEGLQRDIATAAAEAAHAVQRMGEKARTEYEAAENATERHVVDVKGGKKGAKAVIGSGPVED